MLSNVKQNIAYKSILQNWFLVKITEKNYSIEYSFSTITERNNHADT